MTDNNEIHLYLQTIIVSHIIHFSFIDSIYRILMLRYIEITNNITAMGQNHKTCQYGVNVFYVVNFYFL